MKANKKTKHSSQPVQPQDTSRVNPYGAGFHLSTSSISALPYNDLGIYVRYHKVKSNDIVIKESTHHTLWVDTPDRELLITQDGYRRRTLRPTLKESFDEYVPITFYDEKWADLGIKTFMINNVSEGLGKVDTQIRSPSAKKLVGGKHRIEVQVDSGGFQLRSGIVNFIDPVKYQKWANNNADVGVALDIPCSASFDDSLLKEAAKIQVLNTKLLKEHKAKGYDIMNLCQGYSLASYEMFHNIIKDKELNRLCVVGVSNGTRVTSLGDKLLFMLNHRDDYEHYHLLGLASYAVTPIYVKAVNTPLFNNTLITSDASTAMKSALFRTYHMQRGSTMPVERINLTARDISTKPSSYDTLKCTCPMCATVKYTDVIKYASNSPSIIYNLLGAHNAYDTTRYNNMMDDFAKQCTSKEYSDIVASQLRNNSQKNQTIKALEMLDFITKEGPDATRKSFRIFFEENRMFSKKGAHKLDLRVDADDIEDVVDTSIHRDADAKIGSVSKGVNREFDVKSVRRTIDLFKAYHAGELDENGKPKMDTAKADKAKATKPGKSKSKKVKGKKVRART